jgi:hypothetical protein
MVYSKSDKNQTKFCIKINKQSHRALICFAKILIGTIMKKYNQQIEFQHFYVFET